MFIDLTKADEGGYVCVAQNQFGTIQASAYLTVTGIGKIYIILQSIIDSILSNNVNQEVRA